MLDYRPSTVRELNDLVLKRTPLTSHFFPYKNCIHLKKFKELFFVKFELRPDTACHRFGLFFACSLIMVS